jgi:hypothetical protein
MSGVGDGDVVGAGELDCWTYGADVGEATATLVAEGTGGDFGTGDAQPAATMATTVVSTGHRRIHGDPCIAPLVASRTSISGCRESEDGMPCTLVSCR